MNAMIATTRGGVTTTAGGADKQGTPLFAADMNVRFFHLEPDPVKRELSVDGGASWGVIESGAAVNRIYQFAIPSENFRIRPFTDTNVATAEGFGEWNVG